jgi:DNA polymerase elongation subunit (family B)
MEYIIQMMKGADLHGKIITFNGIDSLSCLPKRSDFIDTALSNKVDKLIRDIKNTGSMEPLLFMPNSFKEFHEKVDSVLTYSILIFGILLDGRKTAVILEGFKPYFDVEKPSNISESAFVAKINSIVEEQYSSSSSELLHKNGFECYEYNKRIFIRVYFTNLWNRKKALKYFVETLQYDTRTDDDTHIERVLCRDNLMQWGTWNNINKFKTFKAEAVCKIPTFRINYLNFATYEGDLTTDSNLLRDLTLVEAWDIEAYTDTGEMPNAENINDPAYQISKTYRWKDGKESIFKTCFTSRDCAPREGVLIVKCKNEKELIKAAFIISNYMMPDFIADFNGGDFDWPFIIKKATLHNALIFIRDQLCLYNDYRYDKLSEHEKKEHILKWDCQKKCIKLEADTSAYSTTLSLPNYICIDTRTILRKIYPTEPKSSLKHYLEMHNLKGKEDMPISETFRIYRESVSIEKEINCMVAAKAADNLQNVQKRFDINKKEMSEVAYYCTIDAERCHDLLQKLNVITDKREIANISFTTVFDAIYYADGMKVRNLIIAEGQKRDILFPMRPKYVADEGKYPGAYVHPPIKGMVKPKLTARERKLCLSEWKDIPEEDIVKMEDIIRSKGIIVPSESKESVVRYEFTHPDSLHLFDKFISETSGRPISGLDFSSLYPSIIMTYNMSPEYMAFTESKAKQLEKEGHDLHKIEFMFNGAPQIAWTIRHDTLDGINLLPNKTINKFGLYPSILKNLFDKRSIRSHQNNYYL